MVCCDNIKPGVFKHKIIIQRAVKTPDGSGGFTTVWGTFKTVRSKIKPVSAKERYFSKRLEADTTHKVTMRYFGGLLASDRINYNGRLFQIRGILNIDEADRFYEIDAEEGVAQ